MFVIEGLDGERSPRCMCLSPKFRTPKVVRLLSCARQSIQPPLRQACATQSPGIDKGLPLDQIETWSSLVSASVGQPRFRTILLAAFSVLALVIASVGIYGVMNYLVSQRIQEFGIRLAIGATEGDVLRLVLRQAAVLIASGLGLGLLGSAMLARLITGLLYGVSAFRSV